MASTGTGSAPWGVVAMIGFAAATTALLSCSREPRPGPVDGATATAMVDRLAPACRPTAHRLLRAALDGTTRGWLDERGMHAVLDPLEEGGPAFCAAVDEQRFLLGAV